MLALNEADNLAVYSDPSVAAHYAALKGLAACERFLLDKYIHRGMDVFDLGVEGGRTTPNFSGVAEWCLGVDDSDWYYYLSSKNECGRSTAKCE